MLFGLFSSMTVSSSRSGNAISRPEMIWEPLMPDIEAFPALREPTTSRGTKTSAAADVLEFPAGLADGLASAALPAVLLPVLATETALPACLAALSPAWTSFTPKADIISGAPLSGLPVNVFSPVTLTSPSFSTERSGIIILVRSPDSPVCKVLSFNDFSLAPMPLMVNADPSLATLPEAYERPTVTSAPIALATATADSLSPQGE